MKAGILNLIIMTALMASAQAQDNTYFLYKAESKGTVYKYEVKSNDNYILAGCPNLPAAAVNTTPVRLLDLKDNVCVIYNDKANEKWYHIESLDTIYKDVCVPADLKEEKIIDGHHCKKYKADVEIDFVGVGMMAAQTQKVLYSYIIWVTTEIKANPKVAKYLLASISGQILHAEVPGVTVKLEYKMKMGKRTVSEGSVDFEKASTTQLKDSEVKLPWVSGDMLRAIASTTETTRYGGNKMDTKVYHIESLWTNEDPKPYEERLKKLFLQVTGKEVEKFYLGARLNRYQ